MRLLTLKSILVAIAPGQVSTAAVHTAARLAALAGATLHLVRVSDGSDGDDDTRLREDFARAAPDAPRPETARVIPGIPAAVIVEHAGRVGADTIVLGPHGRDESGGEMGSTAARVVRTAACPCLVTATELRLPLQRVVVPVDLSEAASSALAVAVAWASALRPPGDSARLTALHVTTDPASPTAEVALAAEVERARAHGGRAARVDVDERVAPGNDPAAQILHHAASHPTDLIVMGTSGTAGAIGLGSVSDTVSRETPCALLLVPPAR